MSSIWDYIPVTRAEIRTVIQQEINKVLASAIQNATASKLSELNSHIAAVEESVTILGERMPANWDELDADLQTLIAGYQSVVAENVILRQNAANASADQQQAIQDALTADNAVDQSAVDAADALIEQTLNPPAPDQPPADGGQ